MFPQLLPGAYAITVESTGFRKVERKDITLLANDKISVGVLTLQIGAVTEVVEVSAALVQLKTESSERSEAIVGQQLQNIAVNSRSYLQLAGLVPGIVSTANLTTGGVGGLANISTNGQRFDHNNVTLDGIGNVDTGANFTSLTNPAITNLYARPDGSVNNINGFGTVSGARDPRIMQLVVRIQS